MRIRRLFAGAAVGAVCVLVSAHSSVAAYVEVSIVETETAGRPGQTFRQEQEREPKFWGRQFDRSWNRAKFWGRPSDRSRKRINLKRNHLDRNRMRLRSRNGNRS